MLALALIHGLPLTGPLMLCLISHYHLVNKIRFFFCCPRSPRCSPNHQRYARQTRAKDVDSSLCHQQYAHLQAPQPREPGPGQLLSQHFCLSSLKEFIDHVPGDVSARVPGDVQRAQVRARMEVSDDHDSAGGSECLYLQHVQFCAEPQPRQEVVL
eukprot:2592133-Rhodomonas_salina.1